MEQEDRIDIYIIPPNFAEEGTLLSGRIKTRNAVETGVILLILVPVLLSLNTTVRVKMYIGMIVLVPVMILSVIGVQGESLFAFIGSFFQYIKQRRYLGPPDERYRMEQNRRKRRDQKVRGRKKEGGQHEKRGSLGKQESDEPERCSGYEGKNGQRKPEGMEQGRKEPGGMDSGGKGAGRKAPGGMEPGRKGTGRKAPRGKEMGGENTGRKE